MSDITEFFEKQVVFLTGSTGGLGGCLLYKLSVVLNVKKIYALVRGSDTIAIERWGNTMPSQVEQLKARISAGKLILVVGDLTEEGLGMDNNITSHMRSDVTSIINAAANISLVADLKDVVNDNCLTAIRLAGLATSFSSLKHFVQVSSAYANSWLPDGVIEEKIYPLTNPDEPEKELHEIWCQTGTTQLAKKFPWDYAYSKHLMERLLRSRFQTLPLLVVRPTSIGPAIAQPFPLYGPQGSCPMSTLLSRLTKPTGGFSIWSSTKEGNNVLDEIPVDIAANVIIYHIFTGNTGIANLSSAYYEPKTLNWFLQLPHRYSKFVPEAWAKSIPKPQFNSYRPESKEAKFYRICTHDWQFPAESREKLQSIRGPLSEGLDMYTNEEYTTQRMFQVFQGWHNRDIKSKL